MNIAEAAQALKHLPDLELVTEADMATFDYNGTMETLGAIGWTARARWREAGVMTRSMSVYADHEPEALDKLVETLRTRP